MKVKFSRFLDKFNREDIQMYLDNDLTTREVSKIVDIPEKRLGEMLKYYSMSVRRKGVTYKVNHDYFNTIDSENKAYILGFLVADGSLEIFKRKNKYSKRVVFNNSSSKRDY